MVTWWTWREMAIHIVLLVMLFHAQTPDEDLSVDDKTIRHDLASKLNFFPTNC